MEDLSSFSPENNPNPSQPIPPFPQEKKGKTWFLVLLSLFLVVSLGINLYLGFKNYQFKKELATIDFIPGQTENDQDHQAPKKSGTLPLIAYFKDESPEAGSPSNYNLFVYNPNSKTDKRITQNGSLQDFEWTKDGDWLYWYAQVSEGDDLSTTTFARGRYPDFKVEILFSTTSNLLGSVRDFYPLQKTNRLLVSQRDGVYLYDISTKPTASVKKRLIETEIMEGFEDDTVPEYASRDNYRIYDLNQLETLALLRHGGWEWTIDTGVLDLKTGNYRVLPQTKGRAVGQVSFSPNDKYILTSGETDYMGGSSSIDTTVYQVSSLEIYAKLDDISKDFFGSGDFISNNLVFFTLNHNEFFGEGNPPPERIGLSIIDFEAKKEIKFIPSSFVFDPKDSFTPYLKVNAVDGFFVYSDDNLPEREVGYFTYNIQSNQVSPKVVLPVGSSPILKPQPKTPSF